MLIVYVVIWGTMLMFGCFAVWALAWAIRKGQFANFRGAAASIFDEDEPVGRMTDSFPGEKAVAAAGRREGWLQ